MMISKVNTTRARRLYPGCRLASSCYRGFSSRRGRR